MVSLLLWSNTAVVKNDTWTKPNDNSTESPSEIALPCFFEGLMDCTRDDFHRELVITFSSIFIYVMKINKTVVEDL
jgi:hypothetical protein